MLDSKKIDISVYMLTYYHEEYIAQAIESILMQKTQYSYEIVISDDCSQDGTYRIIQDYANKYPNIIRINRNIENIGIPNNIYKARCMCRGRYIVCLAGDDYWIDESKIQKQCSFLENHNEFFAVCCCFEMRYDDDVEAVKVFPKPYQRNKEYTIFDYEKGQTLYLNGLMMRNVFTTEEGRNFFGRAKEISDIVDDAVDTVLILQYGRIYVMNEIQNVYRANRSKKNKYNYNSRYTQMEKTKNSITLYNNLYESFGSAVNFKNKYAGLFGIAWLYMISTNNWADYFALYDTIPCEYRKPLHSSVLLRSVKYSVVALFHQVSIIKAKRIRK